MKRMSLTMSQLSPSLLSSILLLQGRTGIMIRRWGKTTVRRMIVMEGILAGIFLTRIRVIILVKMEMRITIWVIIGVSTIVDK